MLGQVRGERSRLSSSAGAAVRPARREQQCRYAPIEPQAAVSACPAGNAAPRPFEGHTNSCELDLPGGATVRDHRLPTTVPGERQREMTDLLLVLLLLVLLFGALGLFVTKVFLVGLAVVVLLGFIGGRRLGRAKAYR